MKFIHWLFFSFFRCTSQKFLSKRRKKLKTLIATLIGMPTAGYSTFTDFMNGINNTWYKIPYKSVYSNNGKKHEMNSVLPDIYVPQEVAIDEKSEDLQLLKAIEFLLIENILTSCRFPFSKKITQ
jgi:C-terminal processing protease CtpA/Prc